MFLVVSYFFLVFLMAFLVFASLSIGKMKKTQALVKFYMFLTQKIGCTRLG